MPMGGSLEESRSRTHRVFECHQRDQVLRPCRIRMLREWIAVFGALSETGAPRMCREPSRAVRQSGRGLGAYYFDYNLLRRSTSYLRWSAKSLCLLKLLEFWGKISTKLETLKHAVTPRRFAVAAVVLHTNCIVHRCSDKTCKQM